MTRLLALVSKAPGRSPGQRYRLEQWAPHLRDRHGIELDFQPFESPALSRTLYEPGRWLAKAALTSKDLLRRAGAVARAREYDGVVLYREAALVGPPLYEEILARMGRPLILDFDDAIWRLSGGGVNGPFARLRFPGKTARICRLAGAISVGNEFLAQYARQFSGEVHVVPTTIELASYAVQPALPADDPFVIVWSGSHSTLMYLELIREAIERLGRLRRVRMRIICDRPMARPFAGVETEFVEWKAKGEAEDIGAAHAGVMPLPDEDFARGKCALKALQYMATGRPVVLSPVGANAGLVKDGVNGLWASTSDQWVAALDRLAGDAGLRARLGEAGRATVEEGYSAERGATAFAEVVRSALARAGGAPPLRSRPSLPLRRAGG